MNRWKDVKKDRGKRRKRKNRGVNYMNGKCSEIRKEIKVSGLLYKLVVLKMEKQFN